MKILNVKVPVDLEKQIIIDKYRLELSDSIPEAYEWNDVAILQCILHYAMDCLRENKI